FGFCCGLLLRLRLLRLLLWRRADVLGVGAGEAALLRRLIALDQLLRDALRYPRHALRKHRLAIAGELLFATEHIARAREPLRRIDRITDAGTAAERQDERRCDEDDARKSGHCMASHVPLPAATSAFSIPM